MKLSQMKNVEEQKLVEFFDNQVSAFIADPTSTDRGVCSTEKTR